jgi:hypothetical protein
VVDAVISRSFASHVGFDLNLAADGGELPALVDQRHRVGEVGARAGDDLGCPLRIGLRCARNRGELRD